MPGFFAMIAKFLYGQIFAMIAKFRYHRKIHYASRKSTPYFCDLNDSVLINVIILFRLVWYFHIFGRLYKPCYGHIVT